MRTLAFAGLVLLLAGAGCFLTPGSPVKTDQAQGIPHQVKNAPAVTPDHINAQNAREKVRALQEELDREQGVQPSQPLKQ